MKLKSLLVILTFVLTACGASPTEPRDVLADYKCGGRYQGMFLLFNRVPGVTVGDRRPATQDDSSDYWEANGSVTRVVNGKTECVNQIVDYSFQWEVSYQQAKNSISTDWVNRVETW